MRKITRPGQAAIAASATKDDAIDVEGTDTDTSAFPRAAGGCASCSRCPAASNGGADAGAPNGANGANGAPKPSADRPAGKQAGAAAKTPPPRERRPRARRPRARRRAPQPRVGPRRVPSTSAAQRARARRRRGTTRSANDAELVASIKSDQRRRARAAGTPRESDHHGVGGDDRAHDRRGAGRCARRVGCRRGRRRVRGARGAEERLPRTTRRAARDESGRG